jgi:hypothetical protein
MGNNIEKAAKYKNNEGSSEFGGSWLETGAEPAFTI